MGTEADIHFELYRQLQNALDQRSEYDGLRFGGVSPEYRVDGGYADIVLTDVRDKPFLVIEAKRGPTGRPTRNIDPYSPKVIQQALDYAVKLGAKYFATYNGRFLVLFRTFEEGKHFLDRQTRSYEILDLGAFVTGFLVDVAELDAGRVRWDPHHEAFIKRLKAYHERLSEEFLREFDGLLEEDDFSDDYEEWIDAQGWLDEYEDDPEQVHGRFVRQAAYLLMNRLLFYKLLEDSAAYEVPKVRLESLVSAEKRQDLFRRITEAVDFEAVYEQDPIFDRLPLTEVSQLETEELLAELDHYNLRRFDHDVIGQIYQRVIPPKERHNLGQYYTPPEVVSLICALTIRDGSERVLDPACGSGGFLIGAYKRLRELDVSLDHSETLDRLFGVDINRFPAHLAAINLALQDLDSETRQVNVQVSDFFDVDALQGRLGEDVAGVRGSELRPGSLPERFDVVVGNPPYIRQEYIRDKKKCRAHLGRAKADLDKRSDIYAYFLTHATEFLNADGRLGFITSDRWLSVGYGTKLQQFLRENYKIHAIVNFTRQAFELALISTCVVYLEKCSEKEEREDNDVRLIQVKQATDLDELVSLVTDTSLERDLLVDRESYRVVKLRQGDLPEDGKWDRFLKAPAIYWELVTHPAFTKLEELAEVSFALKTGANDFFYFRGKDDWEQRGIPREFVRPLLKHAAQTDFVKIKEGDLSWYVLDFDDFVSRTLDQNNRGRDSEECIKEALAEQGFKALLNYIQHGEERGIHERASVSGRSVWFNLGKLPSPPVVLQKEYWRDQRALLNAAGAVVDQRLYSVVPRNNNDVDIVLLGALLNSSVTVLMRELHGRIEQGEGMNRSTLATYEAESLPVIDPREIDSSAKDKIRSAFEQLVEEEREVDEQRRHELRRHLDGAVMDAVGLGSKVKELESAVQVLLAAREAGAGQYTEVLVSGEPEEDRAVDISGARRLDRHSRDGEQIQLGGL